MRAGGGMRNDETKGKELRRNLVMRVDRVGRLQSMVITTTRAYGRSDQMDGWMDGWMDALMDMRRDDIVQSTNSARYETRYLDTHAVDR